MTPRYVMLEKSDGAAIVVDRTKVIAAIQLPTGVSLRFVEGDNVALKAGFEAVTDQLGLRLVIKNPTGQSGPLSVNHDYLITAEEIGGRMVMNFVGALSASQPIIPGETILNVLLFAEEASQRSNPE